jgi:hypothetical protein
MGEETNLGNNPIDETIAWAIEDHFEPKSQAQIDVQARVTSQLPGIGQHFIYMTERLAELAGTCRAVGRPLIPINAFGEWYIKNFMRKTVAIKGKGREEATMVLMELRKTQSLLAGSLMADDKADEKEGKEDGQRFRFRRDKEQE